MGSIQREKQPSMQREDQTDHGNGRAVSMVSLILSLHRGLFLPLNGAHFAPERVTCRRPLPPVDGSPVLRVLSAGLTSARSLDRPCLGGLSGPTGLRLNRTDLPCSHQVLRLESIKIRGVTWPALRKAGRLELVSH